MNPAPKPNNFRALADAWDNPDAFARELNAYYEQLKHHGNRPAGFLEHEEYQ